MLEKIKLFYWRNIQHWHHYEWWKYLFSGLWYRWRHDYWRLRDLPGVIICRIKNHPCGPIWYNPGGYEPDMTCKNCGDEI